MSNQPELESDAPQVVAAMKDLGTCVTQADRQCRRETGMSLSANWKSLMFTMNLREARGLPVEWKSMAESLA